jgi:hypothetical protein
MRTILDANGLRWQVMIGKESWGTLVLLCSPVDGSDARTSILSSETMLAANAELDALSDRELLERLRDGRPWS